MSNGIEASHQDWAMSRLGSDPRCYWCHISIAAETGYRGEAPDLGLPAGSGVVVCTPGCPMRPEGVAVWSITTWAHAH